MKRFAVATTLFLLGHAATTPAVAGVADSPLPVLEAGKTTYHVFSVPGLRSGPSFLATFFDCTSLETTTTIRIGVEVFAANLGTSENDPVATSTTVDPGKTVTFSTGPFVVGGLSASVYLDTLSSRASARILATSKKITCTAYTADPYNLPPTVMAHITIIKGTKQKAAN